VTGQLGRGDSCDEQCRMRSSWRGAARFIYIYIRDLSASFISERERDLVVLCRYWLEENIPV
jgi:hypothetical protein